MKRFTRWIESVLGSNASRKSKAAMPRRRTLGFERCEPRMVLSTSTGADPAFMLEFEGGFVNLQDHLQGWQSTYTMVDGAGNAASQDFLNLDSVTRLHIGDYSIQPHSYFVPNDLNVAGTADADLFGEGIGRGIEVIAPPSSSSSGPSGWEGGPVAVSHFMNPDGLQLPAGRDDSPNAIASQQLDGGAPTDAGTTPHTTTPVEGLRGRAVLLEVAGTERRESTGEAQDGATALTASSELSAASIKGEARLASLGAIRAQHGSGGSERELRELTAANSGDQQDRDRVYLAAAVAEENRGADAKGDVTALSREQLMESNGYQRGMAAARLLIEQSQAEAYDAKLSVHDAALNELGRDAMEFNDAAPAAEPRDYRAYWTALLAVVGGGTWVRRSRRTDAQVAPRQLPRRRVQPASEVA